MSARPRLAANIVTYFFAGAFLPATPLPAVGFAAFFADVFLPGLVSAIDPLAAAFLAAAGFLVGFFASTGVPVRFVRSMPMTLISSTCGCALATNTQWPCRASTSPPKLTHLPPGSCQRLCTPRQTSRYTPRLDASSRR